MIWFVFASLAVIGSVTYNFAVKLSGHIINPFVFTILLTAVAFAGHLAAYGINKSFFDTQLKFEFPMQAFWYAFFAGIGIVVIDLAYFYAVKSGGIASTSAFWAVGSLSVTALLGLMFFQETLSLEKIAGVFLGGVSLYLLTRS